MNTPCCLSEDSERLFITPLLMIHNLPFTSATRLPDVFTMMASESFPSPNAIPPRRSSTGLAMGFSPTKAVLKPVPESIWIAPSPSKRLHSASSSSSPPGPDPPLLSDDTMLGPKRAWSPEKEKILLGPYEYLLNHPGKDIRTQLIAAFNAWLKVPEDSLAIITKVIGMLHTASLL